MKNLLKYDFGIRIDGGIQVGSGHFFRCFALSQQLVKKGKNFIFLINNEKDFHQHTKSLDLSYLVLKGNTEIEKIINLKKHLPTIKKLIVDLPLENGLYSKAFENKCKTAIIDDVGNKKIFSEMLFNGSIVNKYHNYQIMKKNTRVFLGPDYLILRDEFLRARNKTRISTKSINEILLTFGGSDDTDLINKILPFFSKKNIKTNVILGPSCPFIEEIQEKFQEFKNVNFHINPNNISSLLAKQDLVISSSGTTTYELACLGIPTILIPTNNEQIPTAVEMSKRGFGINYGIWDNNLQRLEEIFSRFNDHTIREKVSKIGKNIVDGRGVFRVIEQLLS